jgi:hypothetical protein
MPPGDAAVAAKPGCPPGAAAAATRAKEMTPILLPASEPPPADADAAAAAAPVDGGRGGVAGVPSGEGLTGLPAMPPPLLRRALGPLGAFTRADADAAMVSHGLLNAVNRCWPPGQYFAKFGSSSKCRSAKKNTPSSSMGKRLAKYLRVQTDHNAGQVRTMHNLAWRRSVAWRGAPWRCWYLTTSQVDAAVRRVCVAHH